ncbi:zinc knuckle CX2CX4HX4C containing protein [Tanacetum coccineum]
MILGFSTDSRLGVFWLIDLLNLWAVLIVFPGEECTLSDLPAKDLNSPTYSYIAVHVHTASSGLDGTHGKQTNERPDVESSSAANNGVEDGSITKNVSEHVGNTRVKVVPPSYATKLRPTSSTMVNLRKLEANVPNDTDYDVWLPLDSVHEVNDKMKNSLYGYFIGKRLAFPVVEWFFSSTVGVDLVLRDDPWMIRGVLIFLNKWSPSVSLLKEDLSRIPVWVKFHDVPLVAYTSDGLSLITTNSFEALNVENSVSEEVETSNKASTSSVQEEGQSSTPLVEKMNMFEKQLLEGNCVLVDNDGKHLKKVDYSGDHDSEDEIEPVSNEMASYVASKPLRVGELRST